MAETNKYYLKKFYHIYDKSKLEMLDNNFDQDVGIVILDVCRTDGLPNVALVTEINNKGQFN